MSSAIKKLDQIPAKIRDSEIIRTLSGKDDFKNVEISHLVLKGTTEKIFYKTITEFLYVISGTMELKLDSTTHVCTPGTLVRVDPQISYKITKVSNEDVECLLIVSPPWFAEDEVVVHTNL